MMRRDIAVCVDDYGLDVAIDDAVLELHALGRVSATSCMTGAPCWRLDGPRLRALEPASIDAGLHLDLTEHPFDAKLRATLPAWIARTQLRMVDQAAVRREIDAQLDAFEQVMGRAPDHVDGHQHVHQFPLVRDVLVEVLLRRYGDRQPWLRSTRQPERMRTVKAAVIAATGERGLAKLARKHGLRQNAHLLGVYGFDQPAAAFRAQLGAWLQAAGSADLLMCHPARPGARDGIAAARAVEYEVLRDPGLDGQLEAGGVRIVPMKVALQQGH